GRGRFPAGRAQPPDVVVVELRLRDRLLEDRRVRRHPGQAVLANERLEAAARDQVTPDVVVPDALAELAKPPQGILGHGSPPCIADRCGAVEGSAPGVLL